MHTLSPRTPSSPRSLHKEDGTGTAHSPTMVHKRAQTIPDPPPRRHHNVQTSITEEKRKVSPTRRRGRGSLSLSAFTAASPTGATKASPAATRHHHQPTSSDGRGNPAPSSPIGRPHTRRRPPERPATTERKTQAHSRRRRRSTALAAGSGWGGTRSGAPAPPWPAPRWSPPEPDRPHPPGAEREGKK